MNHDELSEPERFKREMMTHLIDLRDRCDILIAAKYPPDVYNQVHTLRSLVGQIDSAARRWRAVS